MLVKLQMKGGTTAGLAAGGLALACVIAALIAIALAFSGPNAALAQDEAECDFTHIGALEDEVGDRRQVSGTWTTEDCDSRFREGSDAHTYRVAVEGAGRVRIDLSSSEADSFLYLMTHDGRRIADNDDGGAGLNARIERDLSPGIYFVEVTTVGGRERGPADYRLVISRVRGCEPVPLGELVPGDGLTATGTWDINTCGSRFVVEHPAYGYFFNLPQDGRVRIDLISENGDPVLSLISDTGAVIGANDDGGGVRNSLIERYLTAGTYFIEATTYLERDLQPLFADFTLTVRLVDEDEKRGKSLVKIEETFAPDQVIAGEPFQVDYRVGNVGGGDLADDAGRFVIYAVGPRVFERTPNLVASEDSWQAGVSYHSAARTASSTSTTTDEVTPFSLTFNRPGPTWVFVAVVVFDEDNEEIGFHGIWRNLTVLSGATFDPVTVKVDGVDYRVSARAKLDGEVITSVTSVSDSNAQITPAQREKAIYAAGVQLRLLDGIFERPGIASLEASAEPASFDVGSPTTHALLGAIGEQYVTDLESAGLPGSLAEGVAVDPVVVESLVLGAAETASARYAGMAASWSDLQERTGNRSALSFEEAFEVQSQLAYAENVVAPLVSAGEIVQAARDAEMGWEDADVRAMLAELAFQGRCGDDLSAIGEDLEELMANDAEIRTALPVFGAAYDSAICGAAIVDGEVSRFLRLHSLSRSAAIGDLLAGPEPRIELEPIIESQDLRIIARLRDDGRIEHGVELANGEQVLPPTRFISDGVPVDAWLLSGDVEVDERPIGNIRSRRLENGRVELGFVAASGEEIEPEIRYLPTGLTADVWLRTSEIEVPPPPPTKDRPAEYTQILVKQAIEMYDEMGLGVTVDYYNTAESIDGQWYVFISDENDIMLAHAANPDWVNRPASEILGPNDYPAGEVVAAAADADGEWSDYTLTNPATGEVESKHTWVVRYDGLVFGSGWYEPGPSRDDAPAYTQSFVDQAIILYDTLGLEAAIEYYNSEESVDEQWYVFIIDEDGYTIAHFNPMFIGRDPSLRVDAAGRFYGDDLLAATEEGVWVDYVLVNPATGDDRQKHTWAVLHDGLIFASGWYEEGTPAT